MIRVFIEMKQKGKFQNCTGKYSIVLETELNGKIYTKTHFGGWKHTSPQRLQLRAVIDALNYIVVPSEVEVHLSSTYMMLMYRGLDKVKTNLELWTEYGEASSIHEIKIIHEKENEYSPAMKIELENKAIDYLEDRRM